MQIITKKNAAAMGHRHYFTGNACKHGHVAKRLVSSGMCVECNKAWARENYDPEKSAAAAAKWRAKNPGYIEANRGRINATSGRYRSRNKAKVAALRSMARDRLRRAVVHSEFDALVIFEAHDLARLRSDQLGIKWEVDHIIPISGKTVSGLHCAANLRVIPRQNNRRKSNGFASGKLYHWLGFDPAC